ncbi:sphingomyelin phosphodiesterase, putative [Entamoeba dispar SAW760]|uniref:Sphingomyelin phosphodiesterase, putative n=1 Tax=Entamoeba dispar (strain ATCC PRA-260 / SAW760) TaxID=370354 RepID=B0E8L1_ENTDS|nr:sphingomyelin phosphodiesterase, putative [Entamoeba dispar SAW760]EDR29154.1 sphingomyelin phosphodiesterase, putative [Entamoeba dispar SAW760]|eukprot:EDR29154.1 sphingomyelin phosphodiesterase, putative [Entamoeba dispar SAW760]
MILLILSIIIYQSQSIEIIQLTDIHYDLLMDPTKYDETTMCRGEGYKMDERVKLVYKKVPKPVNPYYGIYFCDSNKNLVKETIQQSYRTTPYPGIILLSGDLAGHYQGVNNSNAIKGVLQLVSNRFDGVPLVFSIGNNDINPSYITKCNDPRYEQYYTLLKSQIPASEKEEFIKHGSYIKHFNQFSLSVLSINTLLYGPKLNGDDCGSIKYIEKSLEIAQAKGNSVLVVGHFPLGVAAYDCKNYLVQSIQNLLIQTFKKYQNIIVGYVFGHDHRSEIKIIDDIPILTAPAISPIFGNTPGYRVYTYDNVNGILKDYKDFYMQFIQSNLELKGIWTNPMQFTQLYHTSDASPSSIKKVYSSLINSEVDYLKYTSLVNGFFDPSYKIRECVMTSNTEEEAHACVKLML